MPPSVEPCHHLLQGPTELRLVQSEEMPWRLVAHRRSHPVALPLQGEGRTKQAERDEPEEPVAWARMKVSAPSSLVAECRKAAAPWPGICVTSEAAKVRQGACSGLALVG